MTPHPSGASQTRSFTTVFLIEMWERFGYYGMAALLVLFMIDKLGFADSHANLTWGAFTALVFSAPAIGGWIGDKVLGARRTMIFGACVLASGYLMLSIPFDSLGYLYAALGVIVVGNGLFKANAANLVRRIYEGDDARLDSAFTIYYMSVNIGSTISMLATPWIKDHWGWHAAFAVCFAGMVLGLINFMVMRRTVGHIGSAPDDEPMKWRRFAAVAVGGVALGLATVFVLQNEQVAAICVYAAGVAILVIFGWMLLKCDRSERAGLLAALILTLQVILFFIFYQQMSTSLTLFALRNVDASFTLFNVTLFSWSAAQFQALNPLWIMLLSPFLAIAYTRLANSGHDIPIAAKYAHGFHGGCAGLFRIRVQRPVCRRWPCAVLVHGRRLRALFAWRTAGVRAGPRDDRPLRARTHERFHDGSLLRRDRGVAISGQRGRQLRAYAVQRPEFAAIAAAIYEAFFRTRLPGSRRGCSGHHFAAAVESLVARTQALCGSGTSWD
jgi:proton-dependent oligopeptide transporter, POT family